MLTDPTVIRDQLGFDDMTDITAAISSALHSATAVISARIGTELDRATLTDLFYVNAPGYEQGKSVQTVLRLTQGFVQTLVTVELADMVTYFGTDAVTDIKGTVFPDASLGVLKDMVTPYNDQFVKVVYTAGFEADTVDPTMYNQTQVPDWLKELAKIQAILLLSKHPSMVNSGVEIDVETMRSQLDAIIQRKIRYTPIAILPM